MGIVGLNYVISKPLDKKMTIFQAEAIVKQTYGSLVWWPATETGKHIKVLIVQRLTSDVCHGILMRLKPDQISF